jgi:hypothetical protein
MAGAKGAVYSHSVGKRFNVARWATCRPNRRDFGGREQEKSLIRFQTSVSYAKLPTTFVGGVSYGKSRIIIDMKGAETCSDENLMMPPGSSG